MQCAPSIVFIPSTYRVFITFIITIITINIIASYLPFSKLSKSFN